MKLARYMAENDVDTGRMAGLIGGVSESGLTKWLREERVPRPDQLRRIYEVTGGLVTPNDFILAEQALSSSMPKEVSHA